MRRNVIYKKTIFVNTIMKSTGQKYNLEFLLHIGIWILVYILPFMIFWKAGDTDLGDKLFHHLIVVLSLVAVFYVNYFYLIEKYLFNKKLDKYFLYNIIIILIIGIGVHLWNEATIPQPDNVPDNGVSGTVSFLFRDIMSLIMTTGLSVALKTTGQWYKLEAEKQEESKKRTEAELVTLRQQINPHFLFNTLNNIYALIEISPEKAQHVVLDLSKLMRYVLYENNGNKVALNKEISFIENYVELMRIRLTKSVDLTFENKIPHENNWQVAPMLFVSLVENAFKHGISPTHNSFIKIVFDIHDNKLQCTVQNSFFPKTETDLAGSGIGLENLKRRLEILYPDNYEFYAGELDGMYYSKVVVPLFIESV